MCYISIGIKKKTNDTTNKQNRYRRTAFYRNKIIHTASKGNALLGYSFLFLFSLLLMPVAYLVYIIPEVFPLLLIITGLFVIPLIKFTFNIVESKSRIIIGHKTIRVVKDGEEKMAIQTNQISTVICNSYASYHELSIHTLSNKLYKIKIEDHKKKGVPKKIASVLKMKIKREVVAEEFHSFQMRSEDPAIISRITKPINPSEDFRDYQSEFLGCTYDADSYTIYSKSNASKMCIDKVIWTISNPSERNIILDINKISSLHYKISESHPGENGNTIIGQIIACTDEKEVVIFETIVKEKSALQMLHLELSKDLNNIIAIIDIEIKSKIDDHQSTLNLEEFKKNVEAQVILPEIDESSFEE